MLVHEKWLLPVLFGLGALLIIAMMKWLGIANLNRLSWIKLFPLVAGGVVFGFAVYIHHLKMKTGPVENT